MTDVDAFEAYWEEAGKECNTEQKIENYIKAIELYKGTFLIKLLGEYWVTSLSTYYHSMYLTAVKQAALLLKDAKRYEEMGRVCGNALQLDGLDESLHCYFIEALMKQKKTKLAMEQYKKAKKMLYEKLGVSCSQELQALYDELLKEMHEEEKSIHAIRQELNEDEEEGAFFCEYGVFRKTYHLEKRRAGRLGISVYMSLITVVPLLQLSPGTPAYLEVMNEGMERLEKVLRKSLRSGDVISKYSGSQYVVLLPTCQYETAKMVMERIENAFIDIEKKKPRVRLQYHLDEMVSQEKK